MANAPMSSVISLESYPTKKELVRKWLGGYTPCVSSLLMAESQLRSTLLIVVHHAKIGKFRQYLDDLHNNTFFT